MKSTGYPVIAIYAAAALALVVLFVAISIRTGLQLGKAQLSEARMSLEL